MVLLLLPLPWTEGWEMRRKIQGYGGEEERNGLPNVTTPCALTASFHWSSHTHQTLMWAMKGGNWWWLGFGSMWGGTWKLRGTGGCRCHGSWEGDRVQKHGEGDGDNPQRPWWRLQDHKILEVGSVVCQQHKADPGWSWECKYLPEQRGNILPITASVLRAECSHNLQEQKN